MKVLSLFDGISGGRVALDMLKIPVSKYYASEINPTPIKVSKHNFPDIVQLGSVTELTTAKLEALGDIDLMLFGLPCQPYSNAGDVKGLDDVRGQLVFNVFEILSVVKPKYFFFENVRGLLSSKNVDIFKMMLSEFSKLGYTIDFDLINSETVAPQLRNRVYVIGKLITTDVTYNKFKVCLQQSSTSVLKDEMLNDATFNSNYSNLVTQPIKQYVKLNDILEYGYSDRSKARCLLESDSRPLSTPIKMAHRYFNTGFTTLIFKDEQHYNNILIHFSNNFKGKSAEEIDKYVGDLSIYDGLRYMNQKELEACQCLPRGYTEVLTRNEAAGVIGNGWTMNVIVHLFKNIIKDMK